MLCNSYFVKLLALVFRYVFNHRFFCCSSMACRWIFVAFVILKWIRAILDCLSPRSQTHFDNSSWHWLLCLVEFDLFFFTVKQNCACWYLSLLRTFCPHQTSSLHLQLFHKKNYQWLTKKIALSSKYAFSATFALKWHFKLPYVCYYRMIYAVNSQRFQVVL